MLTAIQGRDDAGIAETGSVLDHILEETATLCDDLQNYAALAEMIDIASDADRNGHHQSAELLRASALVLSVATWATNRRRAAAAPALRAMAPSPSGRVIGERLRHLITQAERLHARASRLEALFFEAGQGAAVAPSVPRETRLRLVGTVAAGAGD